MTSPTELVLGGTKPFALALFAPLSERTGIRPRIAPEPAHALPLCPGPASLLVVEYGPAWLPVLQQLAARGGCRLVAALPPGQEEGALPLQQLGAEVVRWSGQPGAVVAAVAKVLGLPAGQASGSRTDLRPAAAPPVAALPVAPAPLAVARPAAPAAPAAAPTAAPAVPVDDFFDGLEPPPAAAAPAAAPTAAPSMAAPPAPGAVSAPAPLDGAAAWPAGAPGDEEAEAALVLYLRGKLRADAPLAAVAKQAAAGMSELERQVVLGAAVPFDARPIYRAAVMRLRVAAALAAVPATPARVDGAAVQAILAGLDALLAEVNPLAAGASPELQPALEAVRNALVREAVDFSEAAHRVTAAGPPPQEASARPARAPTTTTTARVLSVQAGEGSAEAARSSRGPLVALVLLLLAIAGVLAWQQLSRPPLQAPPSYDGAPANTMAVVNGPHRVLVALPGKQVDPAELDRFRRQEEKKGNTVTEVAPGNWLVAPAAPPQGATP